MRPFVPPAEGRYFRMWNVLIIFTLFTVWVGRKTSSPVISAVQMQYWGDNFGYQLLMMDAFCQRCKKENSDPLKTTNDDSRRQWFGMVLLILNWAKAYLQGLLGFILVIFVFILGPDNRCVEKPELMLVTGCLGIMVNSFCGWILTAEDSPHPQCYYHDFFLQKQDKEQKVKTTSFGSLLLHGVVDSHGHIAMIVLGIVLLAMRGSHCTQIMGQPDQQSAIWLSYAQPAIVALIGLLMFVSGMIRSVRSRMTLRAKMGPYLEAFFKVMSTIETARNDALDKVADEKEETSVGVELANDEEKESV